MILLPEQKVLRKGMGGIMKDDIKMETAQSTIPLVDIAVTFREGGAYFTICIDTKEVADLLNKGTLKDGTKIAAMLLPLTSNIALRFDFILALSYTKRGINPWSIVYV